MDGLLSALAQALGDPENKGKDEWKPLEGRVPGLVPNPSD